MTGCWTGSSWVASVGVSALGAGRGVRAQACAAVEYGPDGAGGRKVESSAGKLGVCPGLVALVFAALGLGTAA